MKVEHCCECEELTGRASASEDSLYCGYCDGGAYCDTCYDEHIIKEAQGHYEANRRLADAVLATVSVTMESGEARWFAMPYVEELTADERSAFMDYVAVALEALPILLAQRAEATT